MAVGIGITPFRSMIKYLLDKNEKRDIVLLYTAKNPQDFVYREIFNQAVNDLGIKVVYTITNTEDILPGWQGRIGRIDEEIIKEEIPDYSQRFFYFSGPQNMIQAFEKTLKTMRIPQKQMKQDYFPGFV